MIAIGDAEGTVSIMQLCKPLYEPANREKDEMGKIFDRESRREKALFNAKKAENEKKANEEKLLKGQKKKTPEQIQREKEEDTKQRIRDIEE
jgi:dynein intermediate chain 2